MAKFRAPLAPGDDFAASEVLADLILKLIVAGKIVVNDFAVVQNRFDLLRSRFRAQSKRSDLSTT